MNIDIILKYFPDISPKQKEQFEMLYPLYLDWNSKINVISRKDIEELYLHHVLHSLAIAKACSFSDGTRIIDIGTGGGFPGIPLAIIFPESQFTLCDSIAKKIKVATEIAASLELQNVTSVCCRAESIKEKYDYVVSRAVTELRSFYPWIKDMFTKEAIFLKGGDTQKEIYDCATSCKIAMSKFGTYNISGWFDESFFFEKKIIIIKQ